jgi:hypothetical protein
MAFFILPATNHTRSAVALFDREGLPRLEVNRTVSWYSLEAAILDVYGFSIVETEMRPDKKSPGTAGQPTQFDLFDD